MGKSKGRYSAEYEVGTIVRIADLSDLKRFATDWKLHHPLDPEQLPFAGVEAEIATVAFYHGGDELYELKNVPGIWHEACLTGR
jgi:hypothetical protein